MSSQLVRVAGAQFLLALAVLAFMATGTSRPLDQAESDFQEIRDLVGTWDPALLDSCVNAEVESRRKMRPDERTWSVLIDDGTPLVTFTLRRLWTFLPTNQSVVDNLTPHITELGDQSGSRQEPPREYPGHLVRSPRTLREFSELWDALGNLHVHRVLDYTPRVLFWHDTPFSASLRSFNRFEPVYDVQSAIAVDLKFELLRVRMGLTRDGAPQDTTSHYFYGLIPPRLSVAPIDAYRMITVGASPVADTLDVRSRFIEAAFQGVRDEPFDRAFSDLARATRFYEYLSWSDTEAALRSEIDRSGFVMTLFGTSIPSASFWAVAPLLVLGLCTLHWVTLRAGGSDVLSWTDPVVSVGYAVNTFVLPLSALLWLCIGSWGGSRAVESWVGLVSAVTGTLVCFGTWRDWRVRRAGT